jgi:small subunit ribosomal protein S21
LQFCSPFEKLLNTKPKAKKIDMIIVQIKDNESIDKALKRFKKKFEKTGVLKELRGRSYFEKPSIRKRNVVLRAAYRQKMRDSENI